MSLAFDRQDFKLSAAFDSCDEPSVRPANIASQRHTTGKRLPSTLLVIPLSGLTLMTSQVYAQAPTHRHANHPSQLAHQKSHQSHPHLIHANKVTPQADLGTLSVSTEQESEFGKSQSNNVKYTQPLLDTPQTVTVITDKLMQEQKATSLAQALKNVPGITMQLGENGNSSEGDAISMRGFSGNNLFMVDGIRNIAPVNRDTFNVESIEVTKGGAGAEIGRGATGGAINLITKEPHKRLERRLTADVDMAGKVRGTADINQPLTNTTALRLNLLAEQGDIIGRDEVDKSSLGIAPSVTWGLGTNTRITANAELLRQRNTPDGGISTLGMADYHVKNDYQASDMTDLSGVADLTAQQVTERLNQAGSTLNNANRVNTKNFYGTNDDFEDVDSQLYGLKIQHDFANGVALTNLTRYSHSQLARQLSAPYQVFADNLTISNGKVTQIKDLENSLPNDPSSWLIRTIRQGVDRENTTFANQTNLTMLGLQTGDISHDISTGIELIRETQKNRSLANNPSNTYVNVYHPDTNLSQGQLAHTGASSKGTTNTFASYLFDTIKINDKLQLMAGLRMDSYDSDYTSVTAPTATTTSSTRKISDTDTLWSYKGAILFKPLPHASLYTNYSVTQTPPGSNNFALSTTDTNANTNIQLDPQQTKNWEVGGKWNVLDDKLSLGIAYYDTTHKNELAEEQPKGSGIIYQLGNRSIKGWELSAQGDITSQWRINAGLQTMKTQIKEGSTGNNAAGAIARWSPELTGTLWTSYDINDKLTLGGGARYIGEQKRVVDPQLNQASQNMPIIPSYWVMDLFGSYKINPNLSVDLNLYNVADKRYIETLNNSGNRATLGQPFNAMSTINYQF